MLFLGFNIADDTYVIDTRDIVEVTTTVRLKTFPCKVKGVSGLLNYHGTAVPVIDINTLCGHAIKPDTLTTRLIIINYGDDRFIAIKAENVTETLRLSDNDFVSTGITMKNSPFLGDIAEINDKFVQRVNIDQLLGDDIRESLFNDIDVIAISG